MIASGRKRDLSIVSWDNAIECFDDILDVVLDPRPAGGGQYQNGETQPIKVLLLADVLVRRDQYVELLIRSAEKFAIGQAGPTHFECGGHRMASKSGA